MSDAEIIKEFLVSVGVKADDKVLNKFNAIVGGIGKTVLGLAAILTTAATGVETFVAKMSEQLESLYFASQRLGSSVESIQDYALSISEMGGTAEGARNSLEALARAIRTNPGMRGLISSLGVNPTQGAVGIAEGLGQRFKTMPYFLAARYAAALGIDEQTLWAMTHGPQQNTGNRFRSLYSLGGLNANDTAARAHAFMNQLRELEAGFTVLAAVIEAKLLPVAERLTDWLEHAPDFFISLNKQMDAVGNTLVKYAGPWSDWGGQFKTIGENIKIMTGFLEDLGKTLLSVFGPILASSGVSILRDILHGILDLVTAVTDILTGRFKDAWAQIKKFGSDISQEWSDVKSGAIGLATSALGLGVDPTSKNKANAVADYFRRQGWTPAQAAGIAANLQWESGLDPTKTGDSGSALGLAQWHKDRQANFRKWAGHDLSQSTLDEQVAFVQFELTQGQFKNVGDALRRMSDATSASDLIQRRYELPKSFEASNRQREAIAEKLFRMAGNVVIAASAMHGASGSWGATGPTPAQRHAATSRHVKVESHSEINVHGVNNPEAVGRTVLKNQKNLGRTLVHNFAPVIQ